MNALDQAFTVTQLLYWMEIFQKDLDFFLDRLLACLVYPLS